MASVALTDVAHFHPTMFGARQSSSTSSYDYEYSAPSSTHRSAPLRPTYTEKSVSAYNTSAADTYMADAAHDRMSASAIAAPTYRAPISSQHTPLSSTSALPSEPVNPVAPKEAPSPSLPPTNARQAQDFTEAEPQTRLSTTSSASPTATSSVTSTNPRESSPMRVKVKSLSHIQSFVADQENPLSQGGKSAPQKGGQDASPQYEISDMPVSDIIEMVAGLLTKITTTNDRQHEHLHRQIPPPDGTAHLSQQTNSVLAFHGKNVPSISILSYLGRIHKYCPTTYEVFLSLLVYFDRMTDRVNSGPLQSLRQERAMEQRTSDDDDSRHSSVSSAMLASDNPEIAMQAATPPPSGSLGQNTKTSSSRSGDEPLTPPAQPSTAESDAFNMSHFFVVDSFNIHRLVIAGVTCASKFFSDIFYTNSRYAKVGGLPLPELNHLELQFLLLNDFRLAVSFEEMEAYGTMLVEFYAREVLAQQAATNMAPSQASHTQSAPAGAAMA